MIRNESRTATHRGVREPRRHPLRGRRPAHPAAQARRPLRPAEPDGRRRRHARQHPWAAAAGRGHRRPRGGDRALPGPDRRGPVRRRVRDGPPGPRVDFAAYEERWPSFVPVARAAGYASAHALPLQVRGQRIGALNLLSHVPTSLSPSETTLLRGLANVASAAVVTWNRDLVRPTDIATRAHAALSAKALLDTATGMIAATEDITPREAARWPQAYAAQHHRRPTDVAEELVRRRMEVATVMNPEI
ncbi:GAF and ANTAR domain-containing protein [Streptomyces litmocidini]|uniref:GAF and ANTAR domain-containing protein n=1 Tax=Streptomyces litmocidini TaxID=67318 RepID=A0ABW7U635_9ACTN